MMNSATSFDWPQGRRWQRWCLLIGAAGLLLCALGGIFNPTQFFRSYLLGFVAWVGVAIGSAAILMIHHLTGGAWGLVIRRVLEAATRTLPLLAVLFVPVALGLHHLYPWTEEKEIHELGPKVEYLNVPFFLVRTAVYFAIWLLMMFLLNSWSRAHDRTGNPAFELRAQQLSGPGLVLYGLTTTFAAIDWIMSLEPHWYSTIFGALIATAQMLPALALAIVVTAWLPACSPLDEVATPHAWNDLGSLLLAFVMLWTYMAFSQYLLMWSGNLPEEIIWYLHRTEGGWQWIGRGLFLFYFALPFLLLLSRDNKRHPPRLRLVATLVLVMSFVYYFWLVAPSFFPQDFTLHWLDLAALIGVGGLWLGVYLWQVQARPIVPLHLPAGEEVLHHA